LIITFIRNSTIVYTSMFFNVLQLAYIIFVIFDVRQKHSIITFHKIQETQTTSLSRREKLYWTT
jgi:hypothetical protein